MSSRSGQTSASGFISCSRVSSCSSIDAILCPVPSWDGPRGQITPVVAKSPGSVSCLRMVSEIPFRLQAVDAPPSQLLAQLLVNLLDAPIELLLVQVQRAGDVRHAEAVSLHLEDKPILGRQQLAGLLQGRQGLALGRCPLFFEDLSIRPLGRIGQVADSLLPLHPPAI